MIGGMGSAVTPDLSKGGEINGDITISGDLKVEGGGTTFAFDEIVQGTQVIEKTDTEAFLVRKASDGGDVFAVDTTNTKVGIGVTPTHTLHTLSTENKAFLLDRNTGNNGTSLNELSNYYSLSIKNRASGSYLNFAGDDTRTDIQATDGAGSATAKNIALNPYGGSVGIGTTSPDSDNLLHIKNTSGDKRGIIIENTVASSYAEVHLKGAKEYRIGTGGSSTSPANRFYIYDAGANAHRFDIDTNGNVGIGTTAPGDYNSVGNKLVVANTSGNSGITIASNSSGYGALYFADGTSGTAEYMGGVEYNHSSNVMKIWANGSTVGLTLDANSKISLSNNDSGTSNTVFGKSIGDIDAGSNYNVFIGEDVASDGTLADATNNVIIGYQAGEDLTTADNCTFIGYQAGQEHSQASNVTAIGYRAFYDSSGLNNWGNTFIGSESGGGNWTTSESNGNVGVGYQTLKGAMNDADYNVAVGYQAGFSITLGDKNTLMGWKAGVSLTEGTVNVAIGNGALLSGVTNHQNVAVGGDALGSTTSDSNVGIGEKAGGANTSGTQNTAVGRASFYFNQTGSYNTAIGYQAQYGVSDNSHSNNTSVGYKSMYGITTGGDNVGVGYHSLLSITTGSKNTAVGMRSLDSVNTGVQNTAVGRSSLPALTTGGNNIGIGFDCGLYTDEGNHNIFMGTEAGGQNREGDELILIGYRAGYALNHATSTDGTVAIGYESLKDLATGGGNTALGFKSMQNADGAEAENTCIGYQSGQDMDNDASTRNTYVGIYSGAGGSGSAVDNTAVGAYAFRLTGSLGGTFNTAVGKSALGGTWDTSASNYNTAIGGLTLDGAMNGALYNTAVGYASLSAVTTADNNTGIGTGSGTGITTGSSNTFLGFESGYTMTTTGSTVLIGYQAGYGINNTGADGTVAIGYQALQDLTSGSSTTAVGYQAGMNLTTGGSNTVIGYEAMNEGTVVNNTVAVGRQAFKKIATDGNAQRNVAVGAYAGYRCTNGSRITFVGYEAGSYYDVGNSWANQTFIGAESGYNNTGGSHNTYIGGEAGRGAGSGFDGTDNTIIGSQAGYNMDDLHSAVAIGSQALKGATTAGADGTIAIGYQASTALTSGANQTSIGYQAGKALTTAGNSTFIGYQAGLTHTGANNVAIGDRAFYNTDADANSLASTKNVAIGNLAMGGAINNTVTGAVAIGYYALGTATCGTSASYGVYIGHHANKNNGGGQNIAIGGNALESASNNETGNIAIGVSCMDGVNHNFSDFNTVVGNYAVRGTSSTSEYYIENVAIGYEAHANINTQRIQREVMIGRGAGQGTYAGGCIGSIGIGYNALSGDRNAGNYNVAIGYTAGNVITTGDNNICIGVSTDPSANSGTNQIVIGSNTTGLGDNYAVIGNADVTRLYVASDGAGVLYANGTIQTSDKRLKENIEDTDLGLDFINKLRPVKYNYIKDKQDGKAKYGIIAQEVQEVLKESNNEDFAGIKDSDEYLGADYNQFIAPLMRAVQELSAEVKQLKKQLEDK